MTEQTNTQAELDALREDVLDALREDVLDALRERMLEAGHHVVAAHNLVADVFDDSLEADAPEEFLDTVEECLNRLNALWEIQPRAVLFGGKNQ